ncbi:aldo/keto reductase [Actinoplanes sp. CA-142083]|uniref:aldo/keto reductase n=1 Tax=Actinoplanes sp. CA-142083 TaxID=3239903 RepID=UPI003D8CE166
MIGLGCAAFSLDLADQPGRARETIRAALDSGVRLLDTALVYTPAGEKNHNERLLREFVSPSVTISTKGGHYRDGDSFPIDGRPATLRAHCEASLRALGVDRIDLYHLHWPDPRVPIEESVGALAALRADGKIDRIGVSNVDLDRLRRARSVAPIAAVQNRLSVFEQTSLPLARHCAETGTAFLAYSPLRGSDAPAQLEAIAAAHGATPQQIALAWLLALGVIPLVGATRPASVRSAVDTASISLTKDEIGALTR